MKVDPLKHQRLLGSIVAKYLSRGLCEEDLRAEGWIGLIRACEGYDPSRGTFANYATPWVHKAISAAIDNQVPLLHVPAHIREQIRYKSDRLKTPEAMIEAGRQALRRHVCERTLAIGIAGTTLDSIANDYRSSPLNQRLAAHDLAALMTCLSPIEATVIRMHHGLDGHPEMNQREVAEKLGKVSQVVQVIAARAMGKLRTRAHVESRRIAG